MELEFHDIWYDSTQRETVLRQLRVLYNFEYEFGYIEIGQFDHKYAGRTHTWVSDETHKYPEIYAIDARHRVYLEAVSGIPRDVIERAIKVWATYDTIIETIEE